MFRSRILLSISKINQMRLLLGFFRDTVILGSWIHEKLIDVAGFSPIFRATLIDKLKFSITARALVAISEFLIELYDLYIQPRICKVMLSGFNDAAPSQ